MRWGKFATIKIGFYYEHDSPVRLPFHEWDGAGNGALNFNMSHERTLNSNSHVDTKLQKE